MEEENPEFEEAYQEAIKMDLTNINSAMDRLIDSVSRFKSVRSIDDLEPTDFAKMLADLDYSKFIISGVMYLHGLPICGHDHSGDEECGEGGEDES